MRSKRDSSKVAVHNLKLSTLRGIIGSFRSAIIAYSGGVDSALLAKVCYEQLGEKMIAITGVSPSLAGSDRNWAREIAQAVGFQHREIETRETEREEYVSNPTNRCYFCKTELFDRLINIAEAEGFEVVLDGTNKDDLGDYRPGRLAASEHSVRSPLAEADIAKEEVRALSKLFGLPGWERPASPCLSSRFPYYERITLPALQMVEEAEAFLRSIGFNELRVRFRDKSARIEVPKDDIHRLLENGTFDGVQERLKSIGFESVTVDPEGFKSGKLNILVIKDGSPIS